MTRLYESLMQQARITDMDEINSRIESFGSTTPYFYYPKAARACHQEVAKAIKRREIVKPDKCERCGKNNSDVAHHFDYDYPLCVLWLCHPCHKRIHNAIQFLLWLGGFESKYIPPGLRKKQPPKKKRMTKTEKHAEGIKSISGQLTDADIVRLGIKNLNRRVLTPEQQHREEVFLIHQWLERITSLALKQPNIRS